MNQKVLGSVVEYLALGNNLRLEILDASRPVAGDRWLVHLVARVAVTLTPEILQKVPHGEMLEREFGGAVEYVAEMKRHFVDKKDRDAVFKEFVAVVHKEKMPYLSHPKFAERLVLTKLAELKKENPQLFA